MTATLKRLGILTLISASAFAQEAPKPAPSPKPASSPKSGETPMNKIPELQGAIIIESKATPTPTPASLPKNRYYYILAYTSVMTDSGVIGVIPGTRVIFIEDREGMYYVTDGRQKFSIDPAFVTADIGKAKEARLRYIDAQGAAFSKINKEKEDEAKAELQRRLEQDKINRQLGR